MTTHAVRTLLQHVSGSLLTVDVDDVRIGDIVFVGGHLVRRAGSEPRVNTVTDDGERKRTWEAMPLDAPTDGSVSGAWYVAPIGQAFLILRPDAA